MMLVDIGSRVDSGQRSKDNGVFLTLIYFEHWPASTACPILANFVPKKARKYLLGSGTIYSYNKHWNLIWNVHESDSLRIVGVIIRGSCVSIPRSCVSIPLSCVSIPLEYVDWGLRPTTGGISSRIRRALKKIADNSVQLLLEELFVNIRVSNDVSSWERVCSKR